MRCNSSLFRSGIWNSFFWFEVFVVNRSTSKGNYSTAAYISKRRINNRGGSAWLTHCGVHSVCAILRSSISTHVLHYSFPSECKSVVFIFCLRHLVLHACGRNEPYKFEVCRTKEMYCGQSRSSKGCIIFVLRLQGTPYCRASGPAVAALMAICVFYIA
jgi:hypothetical protein